MLHLRKLPGIGALASPQPDVARFIVRHKRRRLGIEVVDVDPDAEARLNAAAAGDGRSGSAVAALCGGPPKADKPYDF